LLPELIHLDDWGYPIIAEGPIDSALMPHVGRAISGCPQLALRAERTRRLIVKGR
jgi:ferredoxin